MDSPAHSKRNEEIEALRGVAILFVMFHHNHGLLPWGSWGGNLLNAKLGLWAGVDLFFCVSGYVIARSVGKQFETTDRAAYWKAVKAFWTRRIFRLWPSSWLWLVLSLLLTIGFNRSGVFGTLWPNIVDSIAAIANVSNWHWYHCFNHHFPDEVCGINGIYWSLSLEEQFYLFFPLLFLMARRWRGYLLLGLLILQLPIERPHWSANALSFARTDAIILGVLIAQATHQSGYAVFEPRMLGRRALRSVFTPLLLFSIAVCATPEGPKQVGMVSFSTGLVALLCALTVLIASFDRGYLFGDSWVRKVLSAIGARSYALYLIHPLAYAAVQEIWFRLSPTGTQFDGTYTIRFCATALVLIAVLTELNYRWVETPLRRLGARLSRQIAGQEHSA